MLVATAPYPRCPKVGAPGHGLRLFLDGFQDILWQGIPQQPAKALRPLWWKCMPRSALLSCSGCCNHLIKSLYVSLTTLSGKLQSQPTAQADVGLSL